MFYTLLINPYNKIRGWLLYILLKIRNKPIVFKDRFGDKYWQYLGENDIPTICRFNTVGDSISVVQYIQNNITAGSFCIDIGARIGGVSIPMWRNTGLNGRVFSIEADPRNIPMIKNNLKLNNYPIDYIVNVAISNKNNTVQLRCYKERNGWQTLGNPSFASNCESFTVDVPAITFEYFLTRYNVTENIDLVKMDVEGAELLILEGMRDVLLKKQVSQIIFEVNYLMLEGLNYSVEQLISFWDDFDYTLWKIENGGKLVTFSNSWPENEVGDCVALANS